jgi:hypothetical protein
LTRVVDNGARDGEVNHDYSQSLEGLKQCELATSGWIKSASHNDCEPEGQEQYRRTRNEEIQNPSKYCRGVEERLARGYIEWI